jgi:hypothetical protein
MGLTYNTEYCWIVLHECTRVVCYDLVGARGGTCTYAFYMLQILDTPGLCSMNVRVLYMLCSGLEHMVLRV